MIKLSIITPYYKTLEATLHLAKVLEPQLNEEIEWIIIDDGCNENELDKINAIVIHLPKNSGGASVPRNIGLNYSHGQYISFIDSDDLVSDNYIESIINKINNDTFDYCFISWDSSHLGTIIIDEKHPVPEWNCCVWNCIYSRNIIKNNRFNPNLIIAEDYDFNKRVRHGKESYIKDILYHYTKNPEGLTAKHNPLYNK